MVLLGLVTETEAVKIGVSRMKRHHHQSNVQLMKEEPTALSTKDKKAKAAAKPAPAKEEAKGVSKVVKGATKPMSKVEYDDYTQKDKVPVWGPHVKYSDQLANGDHDDDKELEDENDPRDLIVDDDGFVN